jgi:hypothetical protein
MLETIYGDYYGMVQQIAGEYRSKYSMVEKNDIEQEIWLWFITHPNKFKEWTTEHGQKDSDKLIAKSLRNAALDYCLKEKASKDGYHTSDTFWYTKEFVKTLIPGILTGNWERMESALTEGGRGTKAPSEANDWMAYIADIKSAFEKLTEQEQNLVFLFYAQDVDGNQLQELADDARATPKATAMAANRALNKIVKHLGGFPPFKDRDSNGQDN